MKKAISLLIVIGIFFASCIKAFAASEYIVKSETGADMYNGMSAASGYLLTVPKNTILTAEDDGDLTWLKTSFEGFTGWIEKAKLEAYPKTIVTANIEKIKIKSLPDKTEFFEDDGLDTSGLKVAAVYKNGTEAELLGFTVTAPDMEAVGTADVLVEWNGFSCGYEITIKPLEIASLTIETPPDKTEYIEGESLDLTGTKLTATLKNGETRNVRHFTYDGYDSSKIGEQEIKIVYKDHYAKQKITVKEKTLESISIAAEPTKKDYYGTDFKLNLQGLVLRAFYDNGTVESVSPEKAYCDKTINLGKNTVVLVYKDKTASFDINVRAKLSTGIRLTPPEKTTYNVGEKLDLSGLICYLVYNDDSLVAVDDYTVSEDVVLTKVGINNIYVEYKSYRAYFTVTVEPSVLQGDANGDGRITAKDARMVLRFAAGLDIYVNGEMDTCDMDGDGDIKAKDARMILRIAAGLPPVAK